MLSWNEGPAFGVHPQPRPGSRPPVPGPTAGFCTGSDRLTCAGRSGPTGKSTVGAFFISVATRTQHGLEKNRRGLREKQADARCAKKKPSPRGSPLQNDGPTGQRKEASSEEGLCLRRTTEGKVAGLSPLSPPCPAPHNLLERQVRTQGFFSDHATKS